MPDNGILAYLVMSVFLTPKCNQFISAQGALLIKV